jgi:hypothetical protein
MAFELASSGAVLVPPALVGAWATVETSPDEPAPGERMHTFDASQCWCQRSRHRML